MVPRRGKMVTANQEKGEQRKQTPGDVGNTTKQKKKLTSRREAPPPGGFGEEPPPRQGGGYNSRATMLSPEGP
jgi:hypothetical protein